MGQPLDVQSDRRHAIIVEKSLDIAGDVAFRIVARGDDIGDRQSPRLHREVESDVARLQHKGDAAFDASAAVLVGPQRHAVEIVDDAIAIGADERHVAAGGDELALERRPFLAGLGKAAGVDDRARRAERSEFADRGDRRLARRRDESRVRRARQFADRSEAGPPGKLAAARIDGPDLAGKADAVALPRDLLGLAPADDGDRARLQQTREAGTSARLDRHSAQQPRGRRSAREMMWRWISLVPSQMRSTRASRHQRSSGIEVMRPMPP